MKLKRPTGFMGSIPRDWIDKKLPKCPFCGQVPVWEYGLQMKMFGANRYHFRCTKCRGIISIPVAVVGGGGMGAMGLAGLVTHAASDKEFKIESVGSNSNLSHLVGEKLRIS
ncbi:MAG: hypothetical protein NWE91_00285 [Candidatus Bathyarchaeota archaeon]|nr:hypothetical protein [Candidatus Bathyarchaeota archaeon]